MATRLTQIQDEIQGTIAKYAVGTICTVIAISFGAGVWATKMQSNIERTQVDQKTMKDDIENIKTQLADIGRRVKAHDELLETEVKDVHSMEDQIAKWRKDDFDVISKEVLKRTANRFSTLDYDKAVWMQRQGTDKLMPYFAEVQALGRNPQFR